MTMSVECPTCHAPSKSKTSTPASAPGAGSARRSSRFRCATAANLAEVGLVPVDEEPSPSRTIQRSFAEKPRSAVVEIVSAPKPSSPVVEDDSAGYMLADGGARKAKAVRARPDRLPGVGVSARGVSDATAATIKTLTPEQILASFGKAIEPVKPTPLYRLWVVIVAAVMVLLPLVYVALIALFAAGLAYHAVHNVTVFQSLGGTRGGGGAKAAMAVYFGPLIVGGNGGRVHAQAVLRQVGCGARSSGCLIPTSSHYSTRSSTVSAPRSCAASPAGSRSTRMSTPAPDVMVRSWAFSAAS